MAKSQSAIMALIIRCLHCTAPRTFKPPCSAWSALQTDESYFAITSWRTTVNAQLRRVGGGRAGAKNGEQPKASHQEYLNLMAKSHEIELLLVPWTSVGYPIWLTRLPYRCSLFLSSQALQAFPLKRPRLQGNLRGATMIYRPKSMRSR